MGTAYNRADSVCENAKHRLRLVEWRQHFMKVDDSNRGALAAAGDQRRAAQADAKAEGRGRG